MRRLTPSWDRLERRDCPAAMSPQYLAAIPALGATPIERTDPMAVRQHELDLKAAASGRADVVFLGDSITDYWANLAGAASWRASLAPLGAAAFGVPEDLAQDLIWRVENGSPSPAERSPPISCPITYILTPELSAPDRRDRADAGLDARRG